MEKCGYPTLLISWFNDFKKPLKHRPSRVHPKVFFATTKIHSRHKFYQCVIAINYINSEKNLQRILYRSTTHFTKILNTHSTEWQHPLQWHLCIHGTCCEFHYANCSESTRQNFWQLSGFYQIPERRTKYLQQGFLTNKYQSEKFIENLLLRNVLTRIYL